MDLYLTGTTRRLFVRHPAARNSYCERHRCVKYSYIWYFGISILVFIDRDIDRSPDFGHRHLPFVYTEIWTRFRGNSRSRRKTCITMVSLVHEQSASGGGGCRRYLFFVYPVVSAIGNKPREDSGNSGHHVRAHPFTRANLWIARPFSFMRPNFRHGVAQWLRPQTSPVRVAAQCCLFVSALLPPVRLPFNNLYRILWNVYTKSDKKTFCIPAASSWLLHNVFKPTKRITFTRTRKRIIKYTRKLETMNVLGI